MGTLVTKTGYGFRFVPKGYTAALAAASAFVAARTVAQAPPSGPELYHRVSPSVVTILVSDRSGKIMKSGSGVIVDAEGLVVTNYHVVAGGTFFDVELSGSDPDAPPIPARPVSCNEAVDLAALRATAPGKLHAARQSPTLPAIGEDLFAIGSPLSLEGTLTKGVVSQIRRENDLVYIQTTAPISPGSSGGGLFRADGTLVGITTFALSLGQNLNFAIWIGEKAKLTPCSNFPLASRSDTQPSTAPAPVPTAVPTDQHVCDALQSFAVGIGAALDEIDAGDRQYSREAGPDPNPFSLPMPNSHHRSAIARLRILVQEVTNGEISNLPTELTGVFTPPLQELLAQCKDAVEAVQLASAFPSKATLYKALDAMKELSVAYETFTRTFASIQPRLRKLCPSYKGLALVDKK